MAFAGNPEDFGPKSDSTEVFGDESLLDNLAAENDNEAPTEVSIESQEGRDYLYALAENAVADSFDPTDPDRYTDSEAYVNLAVFQDLMQAIEARLYAGEPLVDEDVDAVETLASGLLGTEPTILIEPGTAEESDDIDSDDTYYQSLVRVPSVKRKTFELTDPDEEISIKITRKLTPSASEGFDRQTSQYSDEVANDLKETHQVLENLRPREQSQAGEKPFNQEVVDALVAKVINPGMFTPQSVVGAGRAESALSTEQQLKSDVSSFGQDTLEPSVTHETLEPTRTERKAELQKQELLTKTIDDLEKISKWLFRISFTESPYEKLGDEPFEELIAASDPKGENRSKFLNLFNRENIDQYAFDQWMDRELDIRYVIDAEGLDIETITFKEAIDVYVQHSIEDNNAQLKIHSHKET